MVVLGFDSYLQETPLSSSASWRRFLAFAPKPAWQVEQVSVLVIDGYNTETYTYSTVQTQTYSDWISNRSNNVNVTWTQPVNWERNTIMWSIGKPKHNSIVYSKCNNICACKDTTQMLRQKSCVSINRNKIKTDLHFLIELFCTFIEITVCSFTKSLWQDLQALLHFIGMPLKHTKRKANKPSDGFILTH